MREPRFALGRLQLPHYPIRRQPPRLRAFLFLIAIVLQSCDQDFQTSERRGRGPHEALTLVENAERHSHEKGGSSSGQNSEATTFAASREPIMASAPAALTQEGRP